MSEDLFSRIVRREIPAEIVYETEDVLAFNDKNPQAPLHVLIIPKSHIRTIDDLDQSHTQLIGKLFLAATEIARAKGLRHEGYRIVVNCKDAGGQTVPHIHLHLLGGRQMMWPPG